LTVLYPCSPVIGDVCSAERHQTHRSTASTVLRRQQNFDDDDDSCYDDEVHRPDARQRCRCRRSVQSRAAATVVFRRARGERSRRRRAVHVYSWRLGRNDEKDRIAHRRRQTERVSRERVAHLGSCLYACPLWKWRTNQLAGLRLHTFHGPLVQFSVRIKTHCVQIHNKRHFKTNFF